MTHKQFNRLMKAIMTGCQLPGENFEGNSLKRNCVIGSMLVHAGLSRRECLEAGGSVSELSSEHVKLLYDTYGVTFDDLIELQRINDEVESDEWDHIKTRRANVAQYACDNCKPKGKK